MRAGIDHTATFASSEPDRIKLFVGSTARDVMGCKCDADVEIWRPVLVYVANFAYVSHDVFIQQPSCLDPPNAVKQA